MTNNTREFLEPIFERTETYVKTSLELYQLKAIEKSSDISASLITRITAILLITLFLGLSSIGLSIWLGDILGKMYYGFFCTAILFGIMGLMIYFVFHDKIKKSIQNMLIEKMLS